MLRSTALLLSLAVSMIFVSSLALAQNRPNQTQICSVVINVIVNNEPVQIGGDDVVISGDGNDLSDNQLQIIAQEFNISPTVVQNCIQNYLEDNGTTQSTTSGTTGGTTGGTTSGTTATTNETTGEVLPFTDPEGEDANGDGVPDDVMQETIPDKDLPDTGGPAYGFLLSLFLAYTGLIVWRIRYF